MADQTPSPGGKPGSFGPSLRKAREDRGIDLSSIAQSTKIGRDKLRALESNRFEELPGGVFNRGYVRAVAECIGIDAEEMVAAYEAEERAQADRKKAESDPGLEAYLAAAPAPGVSSRSERGSRSWSMVLVAVLALATISTMAWIRRKDETARSAPIPSPPPPATQSRIAPETPAPAAGDQGTATSRDEEATPTGGDVTGEPDRGAAPRSAGNGTEAEAIPVPVPEAARAETEPSGQPPQAPASEPAPQPHPVEQAGVEKLAPAVAPGSSLTVATAEIGAAVVDHRIQDVRSSFPEGARAYFWTRVEGGEPGDIIRHVWMREGAVVSIVDIELGGGNFRAYSYQTMRQGSSGRWAVEARDAEDRVLARREFDCLSESGIPG